MKRYGFALFLLLISGAAWAAPKFPELTGRIVDKAHILQPKTIAALNTKLEDYERGTGEQIVIVTLPSLQGYTIEDYGYQLGRHWQIGQKDKDNGALLIVAPNERSVRIEVGYGLEERLTDAASSEIIQQIILPQFRKGDLETGIISGVTAMIDVLGGKPLSAAPQQDDIPVADIAFFIFLIFLIFLRGRRSTFLPWLTIGGRSGGSSNFRGGGGGFGGGGASGRW